MSLPDIHETTLTQQQRQHYLNSVGMQGISLYSAIEIAGVAKPIFCHVDCMVNLISSDKGIHMSRLYRLLHSDLKPYFTFAGLRRLAQKLLNSQQQTSDNVQLRLAFDLEQNTLSLKSNIAATQTYPVVLQINLQAQKCHLGIQVQVDYSSTCPCSAALARQAIAQRFDADHADAKLSKQQVLQWIENQQVSLATPHNQRSCATLSIDTDIEQPETIIIDLIEGIEHTLKTPVQTMVKRIDEQEFARLNGANLMFCEDAARRLKDWLLNGTINWHKATAKVEHFESLHAHNAVAQFDLSNSDKG